MGHYMARFGMALESTGMKNTLSVLTVLKSLIMSPQYFYYLLNES
jgi:hypothetical protein